MSGRRRTWGQAEGLDFRGTPIATATHSRCPCSWAAAVPLWASLPGGASRAACQLICPLLGPFVLQEGLDPRSQARCVTQSACRWLVPDRSPNNAAPFGKWMWFSFQSKGTKHHQVDTPCDIQRVSTACGWPRSARFPRTLCPLQSKAVVL